MSSIQPPPQGWDPERYNRFEAYRRRPGLDLISALPQIEPDCVVDLGCGTGTLTRLLAARWGAATVVGVDASAPMLAKAAAVRSRVAWVTADIARWSAQRPVDLLFSNAALHWIGDHERLFPRLLSMLAPGGVLAVQMPHNFDQPSHRLLRETAAAGPWAEALAGRLPKEPVHPPSVYYDLLAGHARSIDLWETEYLQCLEGENPVLEWVRATALLPVLTILPPEQSAAFIADYGTRLAAAYPKRADGTTLFPFRRLFLVARAH